MSRTITFSDEQYEVLLEAIHDALWETSLDMRPLYEDLQDLVTGWPETYAKFPIGCEVELLNSVRIGDVVKVTAHHHGSIGVHIPGEDPSCWWFHPNDLRVRA